MPYASGRAFRALGEGLRGIGRTVGTLRRQDEEDRRRREYEDLQTELQYIDRGGGLGPAPDMESMVPGTRPELDFDAPELFPEPAPDGGVGLGMEAADRAEILPAPDFPEPGPLTVSEPDPRFAEVGSGYVEKPGVAEDRARLERGSRITSGVTDLLGDQADPGTARGIGRLMAEGVNPASLMDRPGSDVQWNMVTDAQGNVHQVHPVTGATRPLGITERVPGSDSRPVGVPTYDQAMETLKEQYAIWQTPENGVAPEFQGYAVPLQEMHEMAKAMASGEPVDLSEPVGAPEPDPVIVPEPGFGGFARRLLPGGETGYEIETPDVAAPPDTIPPDTIPDPGASPSGATRPISPDEFQSNLDLLPEPGAQARPSVDPVTDSLRSIVREYQGRVSPARLREIMLDEGYTPEQIDAALGGG